MPISSKNFPLPHLEKRSVGEVSFYSDDSLFLFNGTRIAFFERHGGASQNQFTSLNIGTRVEDNSNHVEENINRAIGALLPSNTSFPKIVHPYQVHGKKIVNALEFENNEEIEGDGVYCNVKNIAPILCFADCTPLILVAKSGEFCVIHAGWRGVISGIALEGLDMLSKNSKCDICDINIYIGPHIRQCCFEVGEEVALQFAKYKSSIKEENGKFKVSMSDYLINSLVDKGAERERIVDLDICTKCNCNDFFSYRASSGNCGRHGACAIRF